MKAGSSDRLELRTWLGVAVVIGAAAFLRGGDEPWVKAPLEVLAVLCLAPALLRSCDEEDGRIRLRRPTLFVPFLLMATLLVAQGRLPATWTQNVSPLGPSWRKELAVPADGKG